MSTFRLTLPPLTQNHAYHSSATGVYKEPAVKRWQEACHLVLLGWEAPRGVSLRVAIDLEMPAKDLWRVDIDAYTKLLLDAVIGPRADHRVVGLQVAKWQGEGWAEITVWQIGERA